MKKNQIEEMNRYFNNDVMRYERPKSEVEYISNQLRAMSIDEISEAINRFGLDPLQIYLSKHKKLKNTFSYLTLEPFIKYLDSYLIEHSGGKVEELQKLSQLIIGEANDYPTARLMRLSIINIYFKPYLD